jgi:branched-chain amino acid aminotransferase
MSFEGGKLIWHNGRMIPWEQATIHVMAHALHYGSSVFEGIRVYKTPEGPKVFRLTAHIQRRAYIRPIAFRGLGDVGLAPKPDHPVDVSIAAWEWGAYLGADGLEKGVDVCVSSWQRVAPNTVPALAKAGGNYLSSQLISTEAKRLGFAEGIALATNGLVSEGAGENLFLIRDGQIYTPPTAESILTGITRDTIIQLATQLGLEVREHAIPREMLYLADELFFAGTAAEVTPIRSVDRIEIGAGCRGPITKLLQDAYFGLFSGDTEDRHGWLEDLDTQPVAAAAGT